MEPPQSNVQILRSGSAAAMFLEAISTLFQFYLIEKHGESIINHSLG